MYFSRNVNPLDGYVPPPWVRVLNDIAARASGVKPAVPLDAHCGVPLCELFSRRELARLAWVRHAVAAGIISEER